MWRAALLMLASALRPVALASSTVDANLVTVVQLEQFVGAERGERDGALAARIAQMKLTERLDARRMAALAANVPGRQSREALQVLADESAFLSLPAADIPPISAPDAAAQGALLARLANQFQNQVVQWPSFTAVRTMNRFEGTASVIPGALQDELHTPAAAHWFGTSAALQWVCPGHTKLDHRRLGIIERSTILILHRGGHTLHSLSPAGEFACAEGGVNTADEMGETALIVPIILKHARPVWDQWEQGETGPVAVFRYALVVDYSNAASAGDHPSGVELSGELAVRPDDGAILRLTEIRRWREGGFPREFDTAVEFFPVAMAGSTFMCPARRTAMFLTPALRPPSWSTEVEGAYRRYHLQESPLEEYLNDATFSDYRAYVPPEGTPAAAATAASLRPH